MTFGGSANPPSWCALSEMITDLANEIASIPDWDPRVTHSPVPHNPTFKELGEGIPFARSRPMAFQVPVFLTSRHDCFIDDVMQIFLDTIRNREQMSAIVPLAIHVTCRPHAGAEEPIPHRPLLSPSKLEAKGTPAEIQIVLGWTLDTRRLLISLPADKFTAWQEDIRIIIKLGSVSRETLESVIGRLNHASFVIPLSRHFLNRLRRFLKSSQQSKQQFTLATDDVTDLLLWLEFLQSAHDGISLNRVVKRRPSKVCVSDSCPYGMGEFLLSGRAWRLKSPSNSVLYGDDIVNNILEFLAIIQRLIRTVPDFNDNTPVCTWYTGSKLVLVTSTFVRLLMRSVCAAHGGKTEFGVGPADIGNKSIQSGAAMALFLANHSPAKIMILGRWVSDAFLVYIRPQVLEWTNAMSVDMINLESFIDVAFHMASADDPRTRTILCQSFDSRDSVVTMP
jgi:hypothetical protein